ncbi:hypothetical protein [Streptomyces sp. NPDC101455]|uniref:hypothetical protein n=1 Tax=Streptomyces sp. NPDC101455 TaxID=3366142 RepID=UPI003829F4C0
MNTVLRSRAWDTAALEEIMHAAHAAATEAERFATYTAEESAAGSGRSLRALGARAIDHAKQAQIAAGVDCTAAGLARLIERVRTVAELREAQHAEREREAASH